MRCPRDQCVLAKAEGVLAYSSRETGGDLRTGKGDGGPVGRRDHGGEPRHF